LGADQRYGDQWQGLIGKVKRGLTHKPTGNRMSPSTSDPSVPRRSGTAFASSAQNGYLQNYQGINAQFGAPPQVARTCPMKAQGI
jgi:hypothetical protein